MTYLWNKWLKEIKKMEEKLSYTVIPANKKTGKS